jgi:pyruvate dehydrogenase E2 component (dihydrolipoamide acetyltransferase)
MAIPITIPRLDWNMEGGTFVGWLKADGAAVRSGEPLFSVESNKATEDVECLDAGTLALLPNGPRPGDRVPVGRVIGYLLGVGEKLPENAGPVEHVANVPVSNTLEARPTTVAQKRRSPVVSPRARRAARTLGIDWKQLQGSGRSGRIRERDVRAAVVNRFPASPCEDRAVAISSIRQNIAERLMTSQRCTAPVTLTTAADATNLVNLRTQFKAAGKSGEAIPTYSDFLVKLSAAVLARHPLLNSRWEGEQIVTPAGIHIGVAVDTDAGLLVPVVRNVPALGLRELAARTRDLAARARAGKLKAEELSGGTFTITNLGGFGIETFTPIINYPQCAILGIGSIARRPAVVDGQVVARDQVPLSLTFDHRLVDGAPAARFLQTLRGKIENPSPWLMS